MLCYSRSTMRTGKSGRGKAARVQAAVFVLGAVSRRAHRSAGRAITRSKGPSSVARKPEGRRRSYWCPRDECARLCFCFFVCRWLVYFFICLFVQGLVCFFVHGWLVYLYLFVVDWLIGQWLIGVFFCVCVVVLLLLLLLSNGVSC